MGYRKTFVTETAIKKWLRANEATVRRLYLQKDLTARKFAENQNVEYDKRFQKLLGELFPKGKGHGGTRLHSGNKKGGIQFCGVCRKSVAPKKNCNCELVVLFPNSKREGAEWKERLDKAGCPYNFSIIRWKNGLTINQEDAKNIRKE